jgi:L-arabinose isomerase
MQATKIGLFGIGLDKYWPQFNGLKLRLEGYLAEVHRQLKRPGVEVVNLGLIDTPAMAFEAGYALSSTVLPVVQRAKVPVIILNLSPEAASAHCGGFLLPPC